ncbi:MAG: hypothetical protein JWR24_2503 [Actinoallomurus sp.]|nr:hypothetical protein [Actinoallomurus sp.]
MLAATAVGLVLFPAAPARATPDPSSDQWWFSAWGVQEQVWPLSKGAGVTVAVLDSGVNAKLPELSGAVLRGGDTIDASTDGRTDLDDEGDGHGTAMAALIAGQGKGAGHLVGIAPDSKILPVRAYSQRGDINFDQTLAKGIRFAADHGAKVVSMSVGEDARSFPGHCSQELHDAVAYAIQHDVVLVASAGDDGRGANAPDQPASCPGVLAVGAVDGMLRPWPDTQRQSYVSVAGPGYGVGFVGKTGKYFSNGWGTSQAAALTAGAAALVRSRNPQMAARQVVQRIIATAKDVSAPGRDDLTGYGVVRINRAMDPAHYPVPQNAPNPVFDALGKGSTGRQTASQPRHAAPRKKRENTLPIALALAGIAAAAVVVGTVIVRRRSGRRAPASPSQGTAGGTHDVTIR